MSECKKCVEGVRFEGDDLWRPAISYCDCKEGERLREVANRWREFLEFDEALA